jgi:hypothetical protein
LDVRKTPEPDPHATAGQAFLQRIGPAGMALFLVLAVLVTWICLTSGRDPVPGYAAPQTTEYYAAHLDELAEELKTNVFPALPEYTMSAAAEDGGTTVTVTIDSEHFVAGRGAILRYFDESLFSFERGGTA